MKVSLFVTCLVDQIYPEVGVAAVRVLRRLGCEVDFPARQTCCGQPAFNSGHIKPAREAAANQLDAFARSEYVISPSGSCSGMVRHYYHELFAGDAAMLRRAEAFSAKLYEFSQFLVNILGVDDAGAEFAHRATYHPSCHGARILGVAGEPLRLLSHVRGLELVPLTNAVDCCGFGGTFAVKMADMSGAMVAEKAENVRNTGAEYLIGTDMGCLMNIEGYMRRVGTKIKAIHLAQVLDNPVDSAATLPDSLPGADAPTPQAPPPRGLGTSPKGRGLGGAVAEGSDEGTEPIAEGSR